MATGETFSFEMAQELGVVNQVFEPDGFWDQVQLYARQFCPPNKASKAVGAIKRSVQSGAEIPFESALGHRARAAAAAVPVGGREGRDCGVHGEEDGDV